jgi:hypothetical protein
VEFKTCTLSFCHGCSRHCRCFLCASWGATAYNTKSHSLDFQFGAIFCRPFLLLDFGSDTDGQRMAGRRNGFGGHIGLGIAACSTRDRAHKPIIVLSLGMNLPIHQRRSHVRRPHIFIAFPGQSPLQQFHQVIIVFVGLIQTQIAFQSGQGFFQR